MTLLSDIRTLTNTTSSDVTDAFVNQTLANNRVFYDAAPVEFRPFTNTSGSVVYTKGSVGGWGQFDVTAGSANLGGTIANSTGGTSLGSWELTEDGWVSFQTDQKGTVLYFTGYAYDKYAAAVEVLEAYAATVQTQFKFATDGQSFERQQQLDMIHRTADRYRCRMLVKPAVLNRVDDAASEPRLRAHRIRSSY